MMSKLFLFLIILLLGHPVFSQDTIYVYHVANQSLNVIDPIPYDTNIVFENTMHSEGLLGNSTTLNLNAPTSNLFPYSAYSRLEPADLHFNLVDYPIRTAVALHFYNADTSTGTGCSGILVAPDMVLTATHCLRGINDWHSDSILVAPVYNNGQFSPTLNASFGKRYYFFSYTYHHFLQQELALIQLQEPIGLDIGWIGIAFSSDTSYFHNKVFHKLSYPGTVDYYDTTKVYNGDTLYYQSGLIDNYVHPYLNLGIQNTWGIPGQSGSSLFYTNNVDEYFSFGVLSLSNNEKHSTISRQAFYQLKNILDNYTTLIPIERIPKQNSKAKVFPNPFSLSATIEFDKISLNDYQLDIYNLQGQLVHQVINIPNNRVILYKNDLNSGFYTFQLSAKGATPIVGKLLIQD